MLKALRRTTTSSSIFVFVVLLNLALGCNQPVEQTTESSNFIKVEGDDPEMDSAIETAQETFDYFRKHWQDPSFDGYSVKFALPTPDDDLEHIWFEPTAIDGDQITASCANDPVNLPDLQYGDSRTVGLDSLSDWMLVKGNQCYGGYTIRVLTKRSPEAAPPLEFMDVPGD
ncbi:DUF2314 domain-containing protein [Rhodopirellula sp. JC740]|uniref:DUF2314 domain-containing protein n=1 Tax=Rhodopirellula halodulae TaxID=2894198 RepID=A0ABS8NLR3_9BACT|nr:DUF2314 domain-containing protein [Rhodopirellula sp. JC740]MCC9644460.1 DUF2314 domain-containing protein [Rhodopirellula sp. JC740]